MDIVRKYAESWYQTFKVWDSQGEKGRRSRPPVRIHHCPVCILADVPIYTRTLERFATDPRPDYAAYENVLGCGADWLKFHKANCLAVESAPQLVNCTLLTPIGRVDESHIAQIINRATEHSKPLEALRRGKGMKTLVREGGWVHPRENALRAAAAVLWLASELGDATAAEYLRQLKQLQEVKA